MRHTSDHFLSAHPFTASVSDPHFFTSQIIDPPLPPRYCRGGRDFIGPEPNCLIDIAFLRLLLVLFFLPSVFKP